MARKLKNKEDNPYSVVDEMKMIQDDEDLPVEELRYGNGYFGSHRSFVTKRHGNRRRPALTEPGVLDRICDELAVGKGLWEITENKNFPSKRDIYLAMARDTTGELVTRITQAREAGQEAILDLIRTLTDGINEMNYNSTMTKIKNLQWQMSKLAPKKYGKDAEDSLHIDNRKQTIINITANDYDKIADRLTQDV